MNRIVELTNVEKWAECCTLAVDTGNTYFYRGNKKIHGFTGLYFRDENHFFAIYPTENGPVIYYQGNQFQINRSLLISLVKNGENRKFIIQDYGIEVDYSTYIGFDIWSDEIDVDLFYMIEQGYKSDSFYEKYTSKSE